MTTLTERIKNGSGEDRELDLAIALFFDQITAEEDHSELLAYTSDLNAVFALVERELPGVMTLLEGPSKTTGDFVAYADVNKDTVSCASDRCRALLLTLLAAKEPRP